MSNLPDNVSLSQLDAHLGTNRWEDDEVYCMWLDEILRFLEGPTPLLDHRDLHEAGAEAMFDNGDTPRDFVDWWIEQEDGNVTRPDHCRREVRTSNGVPI